MTTTTTRLCQHRGSYGPWYHRSTYVLTEQGKWRFVRSDDSHLSQHRANLVAVREGLKFGRPHSAVR